MRIFLEAGVNLAAGLFVDDDGAGRAVLPKDGRRVVGVVTTGARVGDPVEVETNGLAGVQMAERVRLGQLVAAKDDGRGRLAVAGDHAVARAATPAERDELRPVSVQYLGVV